MGLADGPRLVSGPIPGNHPQGPEWTAELLEHLRRLCIAFVGSEAEVRDGYLWLIDDFGVGFRVTVECLSLDLQAPLEGTTVVDLGGGDLGGRLDRAESPLVAGPQGTPPDAPAAGVCAGCVARTEAEAARRGMIAELWAEFVRGAQSDGP